MVKKKKTTTTKKKKHKQVFFENAPKETCRNQYRICILREFKKMVLLLTSVMTRI